MAQVVVLRPGYARFERSGKQRAGCTISLVVGAVNVLVDTGTVVDRQLILDALRGHGLAPTDIDYVVCTHGHSDHVGNNNLFPEAVFVVGTDLSRGDEYTSIDYRKGPHVVDGEIHILHTPGHTSEDISVVVKTAEGTVVIAGDVFESSDDAENGAWIASSRDPAAQRRSRQVILDLADFIVPGHGDIFPVPLRVAT